MAERIHDPPEDSGYPWDEWTDGKWWRVTRGVDYQCSTQSLQAYLYRVALKRQLSVQSKREGDLLMFRFRKVEPCQ